MGARRGCGRFGRRMVVAVGLVVVGLIPVATSPARAGDGPAEQGWSPPVDVEVVDPFRPPTTRFGPGNRGLEYGTSGGEAVVAVAAGRVTFVGSIGGQRFVVVDHEDGLRSTYAYLRSSRVVRGQFVDRGQRLATADVGFHLTARLGDTYVDPALLIAGAEVVLRLVDGVTPPAAFRRDGVDRSALDPLLAVSDAARDLSLGGQTTAMASAVLAWQRTDCTDASVDVAPPGRDRVLVQVAGLGSATGSAAIGDLDARSLGYADDDVVGFSYAGGCTPIPFGHDNVAESSLTAHLVADDGAGYGPADTYQDIEVSAQRLADLLDDVAALRPGHPIDVAAHSLGGVVARRALEILVERHGGAAGSVEVLITIASPHQGTDLATTAVALDGGWPGPDPVTKLVDSVAPFRDADAVTQVAEVGGATRYPPGPPPEGVAVIAIAGSTDLVVPAEHAIWTGAENVIVPTSVLDAPATHGELPANPVVARELALAVAGKPPGCVALPEVLRAVVTSRTISSTEDLATTILGIGRYLNVRR